MARQRLKPTERITFEVADMQSAPPPGEPYDRLVSRFGTMFFPAPPTAFANLHRWLNPGGRFAFAVWGKQSENPWFTTVRQVLSDLITLPAPEPDAPGPFRYADSDKLLALLRQAGFSNLAVNDWKGLMPMGGGLPAPKAATFALSAFSNFQELLQQAGPTKFADAEKILTERYLKLDSADSVKVEACVHIVTGAR
jgi:SAM-dependent methyltransferase